MAGPQYAQQGPADPWGSALSTAMGLGGLFAKMPWEYDNHES